MRIAAPKDGKKREIGSVFSEIWVERLKDMRNLEFVEREMCVSTHVCLHPCDTTRENESSHFELLGNTQERFNGKG